MMLKQAILLDHSDLKVDQPLGFCPADISKPQRILFDHQLTMINRLMEQERDPTIFTTMNENPIEITTNRLLLNDYVSAGKTTEIIALQSMKKDVEDHRDFTPDNGDFEYGYLFEQFTQIKTNVDLVIVPKHLINQWIDEYKYAYNLKVLSIKSITELNNIRYTNNNINNHLPDINKIFELIKKFYETDKVNECLDILFSKIIECDLLTDLQDLEFDFEIVIVNKLMKDESFSLDSYMLMEDKILSNNLRYYNLINQKLKENISLIVEHNWDILYKNIDESLECDIIDEDIRKLLIRIIMEYLKINAINIVSQVSLDENIIDNILINRIYTFVSIAENTSDKLITKLILDNNFILKMINLTSKNVIINSFFDSKVLNNKICNQIISLINCKLPDTEELNKIDEYYELNLDIVKRYDVLLITDEIWQESWFELEFYQNKTKQLKWKRIILDEVDSIAYPSKNVNKLSAHLIGYFWYYITATPQRLTTNSYWYLQERHFKTGTYNITYDLLNMITIKNDDEYVKKSIYEIPIPLRLFYDVITPAEIDIIKNLIPAQVLEMINAGNIKEAIKTLKHNVVSDNEESIISVVTKSIDISIDKCKLEENNHSQLAKLYLKKIELKKRIMDSKDSMCPICLSEFETKCIVSCCGIMYCYECFAITRGEIQSNKCPNCFTVLSPTNIKIISDDIVIDKSISVKKLNEKLDVFEKIITSSDLNDRKILIFANYDITISTISDKLLELDIYHKVLNNKEDMINEYKYGNLNILLLNSTIYCSGLNLENTTDIIIYHRHDINVEEQIIGRAQRLNRTTQLKIHYLVNNSEKESFQRQNLYEYQDENGFDYNKWIIEN